MSIGPLDPAQDPDRYDPDRDSNRDAGTASSGPGYDVPPELPRGLDPAYDPDRFDQSLIDLVGKERAFEEPRDNAQWAIGLLTVFCFLGIVAFLFGVVLSP